MIPLKKGDRAPDFNLPGYEKKFVSLDDFSGKNLVVLFFPLAFTGTCTKEMCMTRDGIGEYSELGAEIVGISVDSHAALREFRRMHEIPFTLLSDFNKEVSRAYGSLYEVFELGMRGVSKRAAFVIDKSGYIQYAEVLENAGELPNFEAIREALSRLN